MVCRLPLLWLFFLMIGTACSSSPAAVSELPAASSRGVTRSPTLVPSSTLPPSATLTPLPSSTPAATSLSSQTPTLTITPTYAILRGEVLLRSNCRYGPGAPYLYKYGLVAGSNLEVIGRNDLGTWVLVRAIGGNNPCWVKASLMSLKGDVMSVAPAYLPLPQSPYYRPPKGVSAIRSPGGVTVFWSPVGLRPGDDSGQYPYLIEAWVCRGGELVFTPVGTYATAVEVPDEPGCLQPSHGRLYTVEKHGYSRWVEIPWPPPA